MTKEQITKKLKALKALAEQGVGGERRDARRLYEKLKSKYGISEEELQQEPQNQQEKPFDGGHTLSGGDGSNNAESRAGRVRRLPRSLRAGRVRKLRDI